jgi:hypothetical protein
LNEIEDWQHRVRAFEATGAYNVAELTIRGIGEPRLVRTGLVTPSFFDVLGVAPRAGRAPSASDPDEWMVLASRMSGEPAIRGQAAQLLGSRSWRATALSRVGSLPPEFGFPAEDVAAWIPAAPLSRIQLASGREIPRSFRILGRLEDGVSIEQARDDAQRAFSEVATTRKDRGTTQLKTLDDVLFGKVRPVLNALVAAAILVLLVACGTWLRCWSPLSPAIATWPSGCRSAPARGSCAAPSPRAC